MERIHDIELFRLRRRGAVQPVGAAAISRRGSRGATPASAACAALSVDGALPHGLV